MTDSQTFIIVGGGQASGRAAEAMRAAGFAGRIRILTEEPVRPYERPPLSKQVLTGEAASDCVFMRTAAAYAEKGIDVQTATAVSAIDRESQAVILADGERLRYDKLLLATGARVRRLALPGSDAAGLHYLRTLTDSQNLQAALQPGNRLVVVGGGYIGLEVAAAARKHNCAVTVLEAGAGLMQRQLDPDIGAWFAAQHRAQGVTVKTGVQVRGFRTADGRVFGVDCADGQHVPADAVVAGIGVVPNVELAADAGLDVDDGIVVDAHGRTSDPAIFAAGDVTKHFNPKLGRWIRLESWQNAQYQGEAAGWSMAGCAMTYEVIPWFWSDQYDINLQMIGVAEGWDRVVWRGDPESDPAFSVFYLKEGRVLAATAINQGRDIAPARKMIETAARPDPAMLGDPAVTLKKVLKAAA